MKKPKYTPIPITKPSHFNTFGTDACIDLSILRGYHHRMDLHNFITYFHAICDFIQVTGFKFNPELGHWNHNHKRFSVSELSDYFMTEYYNKKFLLN